MPARRWISPRLVSGLVTLVCLVLTVGSLALAGDPPSPSEPIQLEFEDDPPGIPAQPVPGAPAAETVRHARGIQTQANVDEFGANIPGDAANEPTIAVNRLAPNHMSIAWRQFDTVNSNFRQAGWAYSTDGGRSWTFPGVLEPGVFRSDPVHDVASDGSFYYSSLMSSFLTDLWESTDEGATWEPPSDSYGGDKQWIAVDRTGGIGDGNIYEAWSTSGSCCGNNTFTRSIDGGQTFMTPIQPPNNPVWGTMDVAADGTLYLAGVNISQRNVFYVDRSVDAQDPALTPTFQSTTVDMGGSLVAFGGPSCPNPDGLLGQVWIAADPSRPGYVYLLCSVDPSGTDPLDVHFSRSTDGGITWSAPFRVNDDAEHADAWQWFGTMSVSPDGRIDAIWNDTRDTLIPNFSSLYYAYSTDGGVTWSANERISSFYDSHIGFPQQDKIGDYYCMVSDDVGASVAWAATFNGEEDVYFTRIGDWDCNVNGVPDSLDVTTGTSPDINGNFIPDECEALVNAVEEGGEPGAGIAVASRLLRQNRPNPFNPRTSIAFEVPEGAGQVQLAVFDV
ncbi:MAG: sialidase family protein, partial [Candidatus Eiseniibacteriota bacterium]